MASLTGCLGTLVRAPTREGVVADTTRVHLLAAPTRIEATPCQDGLAMVFTYVPLWGVAVGILTFGILVPFTTEYSCVKR
jgi:hypothetical protein